MSNEFNMLLEKQLLELNISLSDKQLEQFQQYYKILLEWNKVMNLTTIIDMESVITKHFVDSLSLIKAVSDIDKSNFKILDVGTGAGFPGIPLKIAFPHLNIVLMDSLNKRVKFLDQVICTLGLDNIRAVHGRAEDCGRNIRYRENFNLVVSRAVAHISVLSEYCIPFVKVGGRFVSYKSGDIDNELETGLKAIKVLGASIDTAVSFQLPESDINRKLLVIKKISLTPKKFPRKSGTPTKEPIK